MVGLAPSTEIPSRSESRTQTKTIPPAKSQTFIPEVDHSALVEKYDEAVKKIGEKLGIHKLKKGSGLLTRDEDFSFDPSARRTGAVRRQRAEMLEDLNKIRDLKHTTDGEERKRRKWKALGIDPGKSDQELSAAIRTQIRLITEKKRAVDFIGHQFLANQKEVNVNLDGMGEQMSRYVVLHRPEKASNPEKSFSHKPPIFLIPGVSNDLDGIGNLAHELALGGRVVVLLSYPESWRGRVTKEFAEACKSIEYSDNFEPHTTYFKNAIDQILQKEPLVKGTGKDPKIELWGYSAGANVAADMLTDENFQGRVSDAVLCNPGSCVNQDWTYVSMDGYVPLGIAKALVKDALGSPSPTAKKGRNHRLFPIPVGVAKSFLQDLGNFRNLAKQRISTPEMVEYTKEEKDLKNEAYGGIQKGVLRRKEWWNKPMRVQEGGKIVVVSAGKDNITQTFRAVGEMKAAKDIINPQLDIVEMKNAYHQTAQSQPELVIEKVDAVLSKNTRAIQT